MMSGKDEAAIPVGVAPSSPARARVSEGISPASPQWQQGTAARILPAKPIVKKRGFPKFGSSLPSSACCCFSRRASSHS